MCTNTLCAVLGGDEIFSCLKQHLDVTNDETTEDGKITLEHVECNAACDYAPVVMVNWEFFDNVTPESARQLVDDLRADKQVRAPRGARLSTWREAERVLAGYRDGKADEGPSAGRASVAGLELAREYGWTAPEPDSAEVPPEAGGPPTASDATRAAAEAVTSRAESESVAAETGAGAGSGDPSVRPEPADRTARGQDAGGEDVADNATNERATNAKGTNENSTNGDDTKGEEQP